MFRTSIALLVIAGLAACEPTAVPASGGGTAATTYSAEPEHRIGPPTQASQPTKLTVSDGR